MPIIFEDYTGKPIAQGIVVTLTSFGPPIIAITDANGSIAATLSTGIAYVAIFTGPNAPQPSPPFYATPGALLTESGSVIDTESGFLISVEGQNIYFGYPSNSGPLLTESGSPIETESGLELFAGDYSAVNTLIVKLPKGPPFLLPLQAILPCYPYQQYIDDENIVAFFNTVNQLAQPYLDFFNQTSFAVYTNAGVSGSLLDWIGQGIYGIPRPVFSSESTSFVAGINAAPLNTLAINGDKISRSGTAIIANDDYYKRVLTWWLYAGNGGNGGSVGRYFNMEVLRLRVARFLFGTNGADVTLSQAQAISIQPRTPIMPPPSPSLMSVSGGSFASRKYAVRLTYVSALGETTAGLPSEIVVPANDLFQVASPLPQTYATGYNVYADVVLSNYRPGALNTYPMNVSVLNDGNHYLRLSKQNASPIAIGTAWAEPSSGLIVGSPVPASNTSNPPSNFVINVPAGLSSTYFQQAMENSILNFPFLFTATVVIA